MKDMDANASLSGVRGGIDSFLRRVDEMWKAVRVPTGALLRRASPKTGEWLSYRQIAERLEEAGFLSEREQPFNPKSIVAMVREIRIRLNAAQKHVQRLLPGRAQGRSRWGRPRIASFQSRLFRSGREIRTNRVERALEVRADVRQRCDDADAYDGGDQAIFDGSDAGLIIDKT